MKGRRTGAKRTNLHESGLQLSGRDLFVADDVSTTSSGDGSSEQPSKDEERTGSQRRKANEREERDQRETRGRDLPDTS